MVDHINVAILQIPIVWDKPEQNRRAIENQLLTLPSATDIIVLPETFTTGFMLDKSIAEPENGPTQNWLVHLSTRMNCAITGSLIISDKKGVYNRMLWVTPDGQVQHYDKKHLFTYAQEQLHFTPGTQQQIVTYKGWRFCLNICYDLRFPVWSRNQNNYDALIYVANWPKPRKFHWETLLQARAIENLSYVIACNRIGVDGNGWEFDGSSGLINYDGTAQNHFDNSERIIFGSLHTKDLLEYRNRFAFHLDQDKFLVQ